MKLVDVMSGAGLSGYAVVALLLFVTAFVAVVFLTFRPGSGAHHAHVARLPLDDPRDDMDPSALPRAKE